jgi:hypothetical protein
MLQFAHTGFQEFAEIQNILIAFSSDELRQHRGLLAGFSSDEFRQHRGSLLAGGEQHFVIRKR